VTHRTWTPLLAAICTSSKDAALPDDTCRLFYDRLLTQLDSFGCIALAEHVIHAKVWPLHGKSLSETSRSIRECASVGLLTVHQDGDQRWIFAPDWEEKAGRVLRVDRRGSREFPEPSKANVVEYSGSTPSTGRSAPGASGTAHGNSGTLPDSHSRAERERQTEAREKEPRGEREREREGASRPPSPPASVVVDSDPPKAKRRKSKREVGDLEAESRLCTESWLPGFMREWWAYREQKGLIEFTPIGLTQFRKRCAKWGELRCRAAMEHSASNGYDGLIEPKTNGNHAARPEPSPLPDSREYFDKLKPDWVKERERAQGVPA
jgi:hypothetical protein